MLINLSVVVLFGLNLWWRMGKAPGSPGPIALSVLGVMLLAIAGWFGGSMVYEHGMAVDQQGSTPRAQARKRAA